MRRGLAVTVCLLGLILSGLVGAAGASAAPANDNFASAHAVTGSLPLDVAGTTVGATSEPGEPIASEATPSGHSVWFRWEPSSTGQVALAVCPSEQRMNVSVYVGSTLDGLAEVDSGRYFRSEFCAERRISFDARFGTVYWIKVEGDGRADQFLRAQSGEAPFGFQLSGVGPPPNDDFADAAPLPKASYGWGIEDIGARLRAENFGATREPGEPYLQGDEGGASVWFRWTAPRSGGVAVGCEPAAPAAPLIGVFTGSAVDALTPVPELDSPVSPCSYLFFAEAGVTYSIALDGRFRQAADSADMFDASIAIGYHPYDDFVNALHEGYTSERSTRSRFWNLGATKEPGEPDHAGNAGGASVWFSWKALEPGSFQISLCDPTFNALLGVYTGSSVDALTPVASAIAPAGRTCPLVPVMTGEVAFNVEPGTTYYLAVDGVDRATGSFGLEYAGSDKLLQPPVTAPPTEASAAAPPPVAPRTTINSRKIDRRGRFAIFRLGSRGASSFRCKLDAHQFSRCGSKVTYRHLSPGRHTFLAKAVSAAGVADGTPAKASFWVARGGARPHR